MMTKKYSIQIFKEAHFWFILLGSLFGVTTACLTPSMMGIDELTTLIE